MILLNLGSIPDEVASKFDFSPGFQAGFVDQMTEYKANWEKEHGLKWQYLNEELVNQFLTSINGKRVMSESLNKNYREREGSIMEVYRSREKLINSKRGSSTPNRDGKLELK